MYSRRAFGALVAAAGATAIAGCSSSDDTGSAAPSSAPTSAGTAPTKAPVTGKVTLQFWTWAPNIASVVAIWNAANPDIQVKVNSQSQGDALYTKLITSAKAGSPPDIAQVEYQALPSMIVAGIPADLTGATAAVKPQYDEALWNLVTFGDKTYAVPQDTAPMVMLYRKDLFTQLGLTVPTTWDAYAATAKQLRAKDPKRWLTTFSSGDPGWFAGLSAQAGAQWWSTQDTSWKVGIDDDASKKVATYWQGLVQSGVVQSQKMYTPQWNKALGDGTLLTWPTAVWGPAVLEGIAPGTKGKWASAPLPNWDSGASATGLWGGSGNIVADASKNKDAAIRFVTWLNTDPAAVSALVSKGGLYPAVTAGQSSPALAAAPSFLPGETDFYATLKTAGTGVKTFTWGPDVTVTYGAYNDAFGKAIQAKSSFSDALSSMQATTVADMKKAGFTVNA